MSDCNKCGRRTNNPPISGDHMRSPDPLGDFNGVIWLCDEHLEEFVEWLHDERKIIRKTTNFHEVPPMYQIGDDELVEDDDERE